jgi:predicted ATP-grasp superfamily ATP-dependent carboligase
MVDLVKDITESHPDIELCVIGSGFDDYPALVDKISQIVPVFGNTTEALQMVRNDAIINQAALDAGFLIPPSTPLPEIEDPRTIKMPCVLTPNYSSGGLTKFLIQDPGELETQVEQLGPEKDKYAIEEFIPGRPMSCTFIAGNVNTIIAINDQLIGEEVCNAPGPFYYCGNVTPSAASPDVIAQARECCQQLIEALPLRAMNGIDFVAGEDGIYFMEVNPRVPGSLEPIELSLQKPVLADIFLDAVDQQQQVYHPERAASKFVLYAPAQLDQTAQLLLRKVAWVEDISIGESPIPRGEPICSAFAVGKGPTEARDKGAALTKEIYDALYAPPIQ